MRRKIRPHISFNRPYYVQLNGRLIDFLDLEIGKTVQIGQMNQDWYIWLPDEGQDGQYKLGRMGNHMLRICNKELCLRLGQLQFRNDALVVDVKEPFESDGVKYYKIQSRYQQSKSWFNIEDALKLMGKHRPDVIYVAKMHKDNPTMGLHFCKVAKPEDIRPFLKKFGKLGVYYSKLEKTLAIETETLLENKDE